MKKIWIIAVHDVLLWRRMPLAILSALIPPAGMAVLLIILTFSVTKQPVALVQLSHGPNGNHMKQIIASDDEAYALRYADAKTANRLLADQEVAAVITIPQDFDERVLQKDATIAVTLNNVDIDFADDIRRAVDRSAAQFDAPRLGLAGELEETIRGKSVIQPNAYHVAIREKNLRQTNVSFLNYQVIPVYILLVLSIGLIGTALLCAQDGERGTATYLLLSPVSPWLLIAGRIFGGLLITIAVILPILFISFLFGIIFPPLGHIPALLALFVTTSLCACGLGALLGSVLKGSRLIAMASSVIATYLFFLGGGFTTIAFLPPWLQQLSAFVPMRYAIDGLRQILFYPDLQGVDMDLLILTATAIVCLLIGSFTLRRTWKR